jgi:hypothetical protein
VNHCRSILRPRRLYAGRPRTVLAVPLLSDKIDQRWGANNRYTRALDCFLSIQSIQLQEAAFNFNLMVLRIILFVPNR